MKFFFFCLFFLFVCSFCLFGLFACLFFLFVCSFCLFVLFVCLSFLFVCPFCLFVLFVWSHWPDRVSEADFSFFVSAFVETTMLFGHIDQTGWGWFIPFFCFCRGCHPRHMIITRCADPDRESAINIDVDRLFSCYHHDHQHHDHNDRHHHDQYHYHIIKNNVEQATRPQGGGGGRLWRRLRRLRPWCWAPVKFW